MLAISYGGGVDSTALAVLLARRGPPPLCVYADTGSEWPETVRFVDTFRAWWESRGGLFVVVRNERDGALGDYCESKGRMPMRGFRWCTDRWKAVPVRRYLDSIRNGADVQLAIGIDADEAHRARPSDRDPAWLRKVWPLVDEDLGRDECAALIRSAGLPVPPKSGCTFCPFQRLGEWRRLYRDHPALWEQAKRIEASDPGSTKPGRWTLNAGNPLPILERRFATELSQGSLALTDPPGADAPCGCFD